MAPAAHHQPGGQAFDTAELPIPPDGGLLARLKAVRVRHLWRGAIEAVLWAATAVALALLAARLLGAPGAPWPWLLGGAVAAAGVAAVVVRAPTLPQVAREVDARLRLHERTGAALEVRRHWQRDHGPVAAALLRAVAAEAGSIRAAEVAPLFSARPRWAAVALLAAVAGLLVAAAVLSPAGLAPPEVVADEPETAPTGAVVEDVRLMAGLVAAAARRMDEDTLYAVERELDQLAEDAGRGISQAELDRRLAEIVQDALVGFGNDPPSWLPRRMDDLGDLGAAMAAYQAELEAARLANEALAAHNVEVFRRVWEEQQATEALAEAARLADGAELGLGDDLVEGAMPPNLGVPSAPGAAAVGAAGSVPAGASQVSEGGGGEAAGLGRQPLEAEEAFVELIAEPLAEMTLPLADIDRGRRIQVVAAPEVDPGMASGSEVNLSGGPRAAAMAFGRDAVNPAERKVVARYFGRTEAQLAAEP